MEPRWERERWYGKAVLAHLPPTPPVLASRSLMLMLTRILTLLSPLQHLLIMIIEAGRETRQSRLAGLNRQTLAIGTNGGTHSAAGFCLHVTRSGSSGFRRVWSTRPQSGSWDDDIWAKEEKTNAHPRGGNGGGW